MKKKKVQKVHEVLKRPYHWVLIPDDGGWHAEIAEFPGCCTCADSWSDAFIDLREAAKSWIQVCIEDGIEIPEPERNP